MTFEEKKEIVKRDSHTGLVRELKSVGYTTEEAVNEVYDMFALSKEEFRAKYWQEA